MLDNDVISLIKNNLGNAILTTLFDRDLQLNPTFTSFKFRVSRKCL